VGKAAGLSDAEIEAITEGPDSARWNDFERALLRAVDELHGDAFITDTTWATLNARYDTNQMMDLVFAVGQYTMVSMALNSFGVQLER
jgi:alkylhydroperoxidase family enzyme